MMWKQSDELRTSKAYQTKSAEKTMVLVSFDKGIVYKVHTHEIEQLSGKKRSRNANVEYYVSVETASMIYLAEATWAC